MHTALADWMRSTFKLSTQHVANNKTDMFSVNASWTNEAKLIKSDAGL